MPTIRGLQFRIAQALHASADRVFRPDGNEILDIGAERIGPTSKRALISYVHRSIPYYVAGDVQKFPRINEHTMYWEAAEMVRQLNEAGYVVDFYDAFNPSAAPINWDKYELVIDEQDRMAGVEKRRSDLTKIYYCTGNHWLFHNRAELNRIWSFHERHGIYVAPERQIPANFADQTADYMTYFGAPFQVQNFDSRPHKHLLDISAVYEPEFRRKNYDVARRNFIWLGSHGHLLKGLDVAVEAFMQTPELHLYICGNAEREPQFWQWLKPILDTHSNIHYQGWTDVSSTKFAELAHKCVGTVYASSTEGGAGSVAQLTHFGLVPIVTESAAVRSAEAHGTVIRSQEPLEIVPQLVRAIRELASLPDADLHARCEAVYAFGRAHHTRAAYARSFAGLLEKVVR
ncbi:glycosyltransferase [Hymenobacter properus]|uniref:Glycosyltransferase n=1 Tax=Hymenobacter properus TaxID=2791026 RepID=A0A931BH29_9BACT|nr:glycosyltransferase [Hymenobacter properus]MBF9143434.1 glycosyltransferase [Hymenobacter properus]MBR7722247.1 glycosyltransferase [Microvirga sp. SRT04]